jgi:intracellular sulfur oxidation DsrE/DsrF family protein
VTKAGEFFKLKKSEDTMSNFMELVENYVEANACKRSEAIKAMAKKHPQEHGVYLAEYNQNLTNSAEVATPAAETDFQKLVADYMQVNSCSKSVAMKSVIKSHPDTHQAFIASVN